MSSVLTCLGMRTSMPTPSRSERPVLPLLLVVVGLTVIAAACRSDGEAATGTTAPPADTVTTATTATTVAEEASSGRSGGLQIDDGQLTTALANIDRAYAAADGIWPGFDPRAHPVVLAWKDPGGALIGAVTINHPDPGAIGDAVEVDADGRTLGPVHRVRNIDGDAAARLRAMEAFEFDTTIGGVGSFLMNAGGGDPFFDPTTLDYSSTLLHEMFHRYQEQAFPNLAVDQDIEGYAYTADNLELAALEDRALVAALRADDPSAREVAARRFAGIRLARLAADDRVALDGAQEMFEGTARYLEHRFAGDDTGYAYHRDNYDAELGAAPAEQAGVKEYYGFGRWYASGAAVMRLLDDLDVADAASRIEGGDTPAAVLAATLGVTDADADRLTTEARAAYDPAGELPARAAEAARQAADEGPVFGDDPAD